MTWFLDYNAGAARDPRVRAYMESLPDEAEANPSSPHTLGRKARSLLEEARERVADVLGVAASEILFCSGGTEANNIAAHTGYWHAKDRSQRIAVSPIEHPSMSAPLANLLAGDDADMSLLLEIDGGGRAVVPADDVDLGFLSLTHAQHETGVLQDPGRFAPWARKSSALLHSDASQSLGRVPIVDVVPGFDLVTFSPQKCGGPKGIGVLYIRTGCAPRSVLQGGEQELGRRAGTQSASLALGAAYAMELASSEKEARSATMSAAIEVLQNELKKGVECKALFPDSALLPNTICVDASPVEARLLLPALDLAGLYVSFGSACSSGSFEASPALLASGVSRERAHCCLRISVGPDAEKIEMQVAANRFCTTLSRIRQNASGVSFDSHSDGG
jgi:cysteine desulfurase